MKKLCFKLSFISLLMLLACDDSVNNKAEFKEGQVLFSIINCDSTFHTAYVSKTYSVEGLDPSLNTNDPSIKNALVSIKYNNIDYLFDDSAVARINTSKYPGEFHFYFNDKLDIRSKQINSVAKPISISATLPNNKTMSCEAYTIPSGDLYFDKYPSLFPPATSSKSTDFRWRFFFGQNDINKYYFLPSYEIIYSKIIDGVFTPGKFAIPWKKTSVDNQELSIYPNVIHSPYISFFNEYVAEAFAKLSEGDPDKESYVIHNLTMKLYILDKNIASYFASGNTFKDEFSVRIEAAEVSNITGGYGLFGLYAAKSKKIKVDADFVATYGYKYEER